MRVSYAVKMPQRRTEAITRRMAVREAHLRLGNEMEQSGERWYGSAILDDSGQMIGSMAVMDFPSEKELREWLAKEPYVTGNVWKTVEVMKCNYIKIMGEIQSAGTERTIRG